MPQRLESDFENDDCLFGEGPLSLEELPQQHSYAYDHDLPGNTAQGTFLVMKDTCGGGSHTYYQMEGHQTNDQMLARGTVDAGVEGAAAARACPNAAVGGARMGNEQVVRNKILKENTNKNVNQKRTNNSVGKDDRMNGKVRSNLQAFSKNPNFEPKLQVKRYDSDREPSNSHRKMSNTTKEKKQAMNRSSAMGFSNGESFEYERDSIEEEVSERLRNGYHPESDQTLSIMPHRRVTSDETEAEYSSVHRLVDTGVDSDEDYTSQTDLKAVNVTHIHNDLWGKKGNETQESVTNVPLNMSNLNRSNLNVIQNDLETDNDANQTVLKLNTEAVYQPSAGINKPNSPIVVSYDNSRQGDSPSLDLVTNDNNPFTIPLSSVSHSVPRTSNDSLGNLDSLSSNLPTSLFFGEGNDDFLIAQQFQRRYDRENQDLQGQTGYDICPDQMYLQLPSRLQGSDNSRPDLSIRAEAFPNDTYDVSEADNNDHIVVPYGVQRQESGARGGTESEPTSLPNPPIFIPHGVLTDDFYPDPHTQETDRTLIQPRGSGGVTTEMDDETYARILQEELNRDIQRQDEDYARMLQEHEEDHPHLPVPPCTVHNHRGMRTSGANPDHQPLRTRYGHTWLNRPLTVGPSAGNNVADSRIYGRNTWQRPLQRHHRRAGTQYDELAYLDNIHSLSPEEGYDIPPQNPDYYLRYEYDPDLEYGDEHLISINRDPHQLAALLMDRAPDMMIPNDVDLNDYEALWELAEGLGEVRRVGMEPEEISILPVHTYQGNQGDNKTDCLVCLSEFSPGERLRTLPCCHIYHVDCIDEWLKRNAICPVCRQPVVQRE